MNNIKNVPAIALVVAVDDCVQIAPDDNTLYCPSIQSDISTQRYADLLKTNSKIVSTLATCNKNKQKAEAKAAAKEIRAAILASLPSRAAREVAVLAGG